MADSSLDDFFAKKDKSKKKAKSKIKPEDILAQQSHESDAPKKSKKKKSKENAESGKEESKKANEEDQEWKDFEEEGEVDYSGLRIKEMQINKDEEEQEEEEGREDEGEGRERKEGGPWNKMDQPESTVVHVPERVPTPETKPEPEAKPSVGKYIPPSRRGESGGAAAVVQQGPTPRRKKKEAPNLHSEHDFPTLGGADYTQGGEFEEVRSGGRQADDPSKQRVNLQLDNKYGALQNEDS